MRKVFAPLLAVVAASAALLAAAGVVVSAQQGVDAIITASMFESMFPHRGDSGCTGAFYAYDAFIEAARKFPDFGTTGGDETSRRELAAFFGQTSHETNGGWTSAPDGPFAWGYCLVEEKEPTDPPYYGRGPIQLTHQYNYEKAGRALQQNLVSDPGLVSRDPVVAFETAIWFWMTPQGAKPSCHDVITNNWEPSADDIAAGRTRGYGLLTNIVNGGVECGKDGQQTSGDANRVGYYQRYSQMLGVTDDDSLSCENHKPYPN